MKKPTRPHSEKPHLCIIFMNIFAAANHIIFTGETNRKNEERIEVLKIACDQLPPQLFGTGSTNISRRDLWEEEHLR
jgi:hypothetical protein